MSNELQIVTLGIDELEPYERNARKHETEDIDAIKRSIEEFGFNDPIGIWSDHNVIVEGHGRLQAAKALGMKSVPCIRLDHMTDEQRRAYGLAHNRTAELSEWDIDAVTAELADISDFDMSEFGFDTDIFNDFFDMNEHGGTKRQHDNDDYNKFLDKFEPKRTTDDCYTPQKVYDAVADWVANEYRLDKNNFKRPFYPGGDYQNEKYNINDIVVDNPPFSILAEIIRFYNTNDIKFFLFAPAITLFSSSSSCCCALCCNANIIYENGANVATSFVTNIDAAQFRSAPSLYRSIKEAVDEIRCEQTKHLRKHKYPDNVITAPMISHMSKYGVDFCVHKYECKHISKLDNQKDCTIYGSGYLISDNAAAEKAAAEKAAAEKAAAEKAAAEKKAATGNTVIEWKLSDREKNIIKRLNENVSRET